MGEEYSLEWLDGLISVSLNPAKVNFNEILPVNLMELKSKIEEEKYKIQNLLKRKVFSLDNEKKIEILIKQYHSGLIILLDQALENNLKCPAKISELKQLTSDLISCVNDLLNFIETRFMGYLSLNERVPATYLFNTTRDLKRTLDRVKSKLKENEHGHNVLDIVLQELFALMRYSNDEHSFVFREIFYIEELCCEFDHLNVAKKINTIYTPLDELLIRMNFNSHAYVQYLTQKIEAHISNLDSISEKTERLLFYRKQFKQFYRKPSIKFLIHEVDLDKEVDNWFLQEIYYMENQGHDPFAQIKASVPIQEDTNKKKQKIFSILSVDQMALILRAADEMKIIMARSLNAVFKNIVPYLSTTNQENISYDSMRSKSYSAETRDKEMVIKTLHEMIKIIKEY